MLRGIEDALWLPAWASAMEEEGSRTPRNITRESADRMPREVTRAARSFAAELVRQNRATLPQIYARASEADGKDVDPEELGYYLTMQALGHGVGWDDNHQPFDVVLPYAEAHAFRDDEGWDFHVSMTRGPRTRELGSRMRRRWHGTA